MLLSQLINKNVYVGANVKGKCVGVGISLKSYFVKYLLCSSSLQNTVSADFCVTFSAVEKFDDGIYLTRLRPSVPKNCAKIFLGRPIFSENGEFIGNVRDLQISDTIATHLHTTATPPLPTSSIAAFSDAVILKKEQPYPIGQRIPAPAICKFLDKNEPFINKSNLRTAIAKSSLIKLTLSLAPFQMENID